MNLSRSTARAARSLFQAAAAVVTSPLCPPRLRPWGLRALGVRVGPRVRIGRGLQLLSSDLTIGARVFLNAGVLIDNKAPVVLEDDVAVGPGVVITTAGHDMSDPTRRQGTVQPAPTRVARGAWIGARAVVLPGVTVGEGVVVAAGAVVTRDCAPHGLYIGVPARRVRDLDGAHAAVDGLPVA